MDNAARTLEVAPAEIAWQGIECCREGDWQQGMYWLTLAAESQIRDDQQDLPGLFFAYLGYGLARYQNKFEEGLQLCQQAVALEFHQPESYVFLAQTCLLIEDRRSAIDAIDRGLEIDSAFGPLVELRYRLGMRRPPVLSFLPRSHSLNRTLGKIRHRFLKYLGKS